MRWAVFSGLTLGLLACRPALPPSTGPRVVATNTYLESAAGDLLGERLAVVRLAEPGMCPGHFDLRPSQVTELRASQMLLRFEFQQSLDAKLAGGSSSLRIVSVATGGGLCRPETYAAVCRQLAEAFVCAGWLERATADRRLAEIDARLLALTERLKQEVAAAGLRGRPVLSSGHQRDFCEWLGLVVVGTFGSSDLAQVSELDRVIRAGESAGVGIIVANRPEGRRTADALAERLGARVALFGNFPEEQAGRVRFDGLIAQNLATLLAVVP